MLISCLASGLQDLGSQGGLWEAGPRPRALLPELSSSPSWLCGHEPAEPQFARLEAGLTAWNPVGLDLAQICFMLCMWQLSHKETWR